MSLSRSSFPYAVLAGTATIAAIVISQPNAIAAKSPQEIAKLANRITVQVNPSPNDPQMRSGSGFIIARHGNNYTVLTCNHVLKGKPATVRTYDGNTYPITKGQSLATGTNAIDLALLTFNSSIDYPVAKLGNSDQASVGAQIFVFGYPINKLDRKVGEDRQFEFSPGYVTSRLNNISGGYTIRYSAVTQSGMSGGPVFDIDGRVVGVHGLAEDDEASVVDEEGGQINPTSLGFIVTTKTGFNSAIPINTFLAMQKLTTSTQLPEALRVRTLTELAPLSVDQTPTTDRPVARLDQPKSAAQLYARAQSKQEQGNSSAALEDYNQVIRLDPNYASAYFQRANIRYNNGDKPGALEDYSQTIHLNPNYADAYFNRGIDRQTQGDKQGALEDFSQYIRLNPNDVFAYYNRGIIRRSLGDAHGTLEDFDQVVRLVPNNAQAYYNRAIARSLIGDREGEVQDFTEAIRLNPNYTQVYIDRALVLRREGDRQGAIEDLNQALRIEPDNAYAYYNRGLFRRDLGDRQGALEDLQKSLDLFQQKGDTSDYQKTTEVLERLKNSGSATSADSGSIPKFPSPDASK
ncbi:MAG: serine protease [Chroococcidiopsidaceae cyanobacterium CP_BM_ER_R8_30]|nr:serine protease [Chroococcidiopsidaceae cyanobacterium CP_BM_ER_R8_30]